jgi:hypothetical protein
MSDITSAPFELSSLISASVLLHTGGAFIKRIIVTVAGATTPRIRVRDGLDATGTLRFDFNPPAISSLVLDLIIEDGIYVQVDGGTPPQCYILFKEG